MFLVLAVTEVPVLESAMCGCVCVYYYSTYEKAVRVGGLVGVCVSFNYFALVLSLCVTLCCSTGVAAQQVLAPEHSGVSLLCKG
jgi:hypothetical protein